MSVIDDLAAKVVVPLEFTDLELVARDQQRILGPYYRHGRLPAAMTHPSQVDMRLMQPYFKQDAAIAKIRDNILGSPARTFQLLGISGCGKTGTIVSLAREHFVIYVECSPDGAQRDYCDQNFRPLVASIQEHLAEVKSNISRSDTRYHDAINIAGLNCVCMNYLARLVYLHQLLITKPDLTPEQFIMNQCNGGQERISQLLSYISRLLGQYLYVDISKTDLIDTSYA
jgi:hypothetical protein